MPQEPDIFFTPVPERVLREMVRIAAIGPKDVVYDLGCGDGRIVIAAALAGARWGVGVDIDPACVAEAMAQARLAGVGDRVEFWEEDFFTTDLRPVTVLALYLLDSLNVRLRPKILAECRAGTRVVTYSFEMGKWECDEHTPIAANGVSLWVVPANFTGRWVVSGETDGCPVTAITLEQWFQRISGTAVCDGKTLPILEGRVRGQDFSLVVEGEGAVWTIRGRIEGNRMEGVRCGEGQERAWSALRTDGTQRPLIDGVSGE